ncbi:MAG: BatA domain-containing protein [Armatimonadota bacterium]
MNFLTPLAFALAALLPVIVALYFLKLRREERVISSIYLWQELVRDVAANAPWQRLRFNWLLVLQLLFLTGLILALARPFSWTVAASGDHLILVIDTSASMGATDVEPNRLAAAVHRASRLARDLPPDVPVTLIAAGAEVQVPLSDSTDRGLLGRALDELRAGKSDADMATALELAAAIAGEAPDAEIVILSDGGGEMPDHLTSSAALRYLSIGSSDQNQAISALSLDAGRAGQALTAFARITNYGSEPAERRLTLYAYSTPSERADGTLVAARDLAMDAGEAVALTLPDIPAGTVAVEARLDDEDVLTLDDRAWAVAPVLLGAQIQIVGPGNRFLELALALLPEVEVTTIPLDAYEAAWEAPEAASGDAVWSPDQTEDWLTIFDTVLPEEGHYPPGALLFIGPLHSTEFFSVTGSLELVDPRPAGTGDPLLEYVDLRDVVVQQAARVPLPDWGRPVIVASGPEQDPPLLIVGEQSERQLAVLGFDLRHSDLPLRVAFPLLLTNLVDFLAPGTTGSLPAAISPGQPLEIPLPPQAEAAIVKSPGGTEQRLPGSGSPLFADTSTPGVYTIDWTADGERYPLGRFAVNLFNPMESEVAPRRELVLAGSGEQTVVAERPVRQEWWRPLAWAALALLILEWLMQYRGSLARLRRRVAPSLQTGSTRSQL